VTKYLIPSHNTSKDIIDGFCIIASTGKGLIKSDLSSFVMKSYGQVNINLDEYDDGSRLPVNMLLY